MSDIRQLRLARLERIQKGGILRFIAIRGLIFAVFFGVMVLYRRHCLGIFRCLYLASLV